MAIESAKFSLQLVDGISGPSKRGARSLDDLQKELRETERALMRMNRAQLKADKLGRKRSSNAIKMMRRERSLRARELRGQIRDMRRASGDGGFGAAGFGVAGLAGMGAAAIGAGLYGAARGAGALTKRAATTESHIFALKALTGEGEATFDRLRGMSKEYGLDLDDTANAYKKFVAGGFKGSQAERFIKLGADMKALGTTSEQTKGIFLAMSQMKALGRVSAEELNQLSERNIGRAKMAENIARVLGKSQAETNKLLEQGKVSSDVGLRAVEMTIRGMTGDREPGEAGKEAGRSLLSGMGDVVKAHAKDFWTTLGKRAAPGMKEGMKSGMEGIGDFFESDRGVRLMEQLGNTAEWVGQKFAELGEWAPKALEVFVKGWDDAAEALGMSTLKGKDFKTLLDEALPTVQSFGRAVGLVANAVIRLGQAYETVAGSTVTASIKAQKGGGFLNTAADFALPGGAGGWLGQAILPANDSGGVVTGVSNGIASVRAAPGEGLASIGPGETIVPAGGGVNVGGVTITVDGAGDPQAVAAETLAAFESQLSTVFAGAMA